MATQAKTPQQEALERLLERGQKDTERARQQLDCDPQEALDKFVRETYDEETLVQMLKYLLEGRNDWDDDEDEVTDDW